MDRHDLIYWPFLLLSLELVLQLQLRRVASGEWRVASGKWRVASGRWPDDIEGVAILWLTHSPVVYRAISNHFPHP